MISLASMTLPPIPPEDSTNSFERLMALLKLVNDPEATRKHVNEIFKARMSWVEAKSDAEQVLKDVASQRAEHDERITSERAEHDRAIAQARAKCEADCNSAMAEVRLQRERASKLEAKAKADAAAAAELKADLEQRLSKIKAAAA